MTGLNGVRRLYTHTTRWLKVGWLLVPVLVLSACAEIVPPAHLLADVVEIRAGERHTCALTSAGGVKCWGLNHDGQLGNGHGSDRSSPVDVTGLTTGVRAIAAGWNHVCALTAAGGMKCWGSNHEGQLGDGTGVDRKGPVDVVLVPSEIHAIATGGGHTCAVTQSTVTCWGENEDGQLGDGTFKSTLAAKPEVSD